MTTGHHGYLISRGLASAITDGWAARFERELCDLLGGSIRMNHLVDVVDMLPVHAAWSRQVWTTTHGALQISFNQLLAESECGFVQDDAPLVAESNEIDSIFMDILADLAMVYWTRLVTALVYNTVTEAAKDDYVRLFHSGTFMAAKHGTIADHISPTEYIELYLVDTEAPGSDFSSTACERHGSWAVINPVRYTPAAKALEKFISHEFWALEDD